MKITRIYTGDDGESHFEDLEIPLEDRGEIGPGEVLLAEDLTGRGHISRSVDGRPRRSIVVTVD